MSASYIYRQGVFAKLFFVHEIVQLVLSIKQYRFDALVCDASSERDE
jgi:hypothetical protein